MFIDTHCHLFKEYYDSLEDIIDESKDSNINYYINNGCDSKSNIEVVESIKKYPELYGAIGIHPESVNEYTSEDIEFIKKTLTNPKIIAIGEIGLDYHYDKEDKEKQIKLFETQLELAEKLDIPVIIHSRDATEDTINILKKYNVRGTIHSFTGSLETAQIYIKMGFLLGINGVVTFKNCNLRDVLKQIDVSNIVLETDSPYLTPVPYRGKQNNPSHILEIAKFVANLYDITIDELSKITNENIEKLYKIHFN